MPIGLDVEGWERKHKSTVSQNESQMTSVGIVPETLGGGHRFGSYSVQLSKRPALSSKSEMADGELENFK